MRTRSHRAARGRDLPELRRWYVYAASGQGARPKRPWRDPDRLRACLLSGRTTKSLDGHAPTRPMAPSVAWNGTRASPRMAPCPAVGFIVSRLLASRRGIDCPWSRTRERVPWGASISLIPHEPLARRAASGGHGDRSWGQVRGRPSPLGAGGDTSHSTLKSRRLQANRYRIAIQRQHRREA
jgi:hypothetical protein